MTPESSRDEAWFDGFFRAHHAAVLAYARRRIGDADADDVVVEVFATAWGCRDQLPDPPLPWLYRCAWHRIATVRRSAVRRDRLAARVAAQPRVPQPAGSDPDAADGDDLTWVYDVLATLDPADAEILRLAAWEGLAPREIGVVLGCTSGAARVRLHRARSRAKALAAALPPGHPVAAQSATPNPTARTSPSAVRRQPASLAAIRKEER